MLMCLFFYGKEKLIAPHSGQEGGAPHVTWANGHVLPAGAQVSILLRYEMGSFLKSTPRLRMTHLQILLFVTQ